MDRFKSYSLMKFLYAAGSDKSHRNVLLIPNPDMLINSISDFTVMQRVVIYGAYGILTAPDR